jgi:hypothetical protein
MNTTDRQHSRPSKKPVSAKSGDTTSVTENTTMKTPKKKTKKSKRSTDTTTVQPVAAPAPVALVPHADTAASGLTVNMSSRFLGLVSQGTALLTQARKLFPATVTNPLARKRSNKFRKGAESAIPKIAAIARQFGVSLSQAPIDEMLVSFTEAQTLLPLEAQAAGLQKVLSDQIFFSQAKAWATATKLYSILRRLAHGAHGDAELAALVAPLEQFFAYRHPRVRADHPKTAKGKAAAEAKKAAETSVVHSPPGSPAKETPVPAPATETPAAPPPIAPEAPAPAHA